MSSIKDDMISLTKDEKFIGRTITCAESTIKYNRESSFEVNSISGDNVFSDIGIYGEDFSLFAFYPFSPTTNLIYCCHTHTEVKVPIPSGSDFDTVDIISKKCNPIDAVCAIDGDKIYITAYRRNRNTTTLEYMAAITRQFMNFVLEKYFITKYDSFTGVNHRRFHSGLKRYIKENPNHSSIKNALESTDLYEATILMLSLNRHLTDNPTHYSVEVLA